MTTTETAIACIVRLANLGGHPFTGWVRRTIDVMPPHRTGRRPGGSVRYVVGRRCGMSTWIVDVWVDFLAGGQELECDLSTFEPMSFQLPPPHPDPVAFFGGMPTVNGVALQLRAAGEDGCGIGLRFEGRIGSMLHVTLWALWRPSEPGLAHCEVVVCAANPDVPDVVVTVPDLRLQWGDALVHVPGAGWQAPIMPATWMADGAARGVPLTLVWLRNMGSEWLAMVAAVDRSVCGTGLAKLLRDGNPLLPTGFDGKPWTMGLYRESLRRLHTWEGALLGPAMRSGDSGAQEDQVFVRGEVFGTRGLCAEDVAYFAALKILARPCHHLWASGEIVDPLTAQPTLRYWDGYVHGHPVVSPNRLGKSRRPSLDESHGWSGPDVEHWLLNTTAAAARLTGSHALQWELRNQAHVYFGQQSINPGWSTTQPYAARAVGWEAIAAVHLWTALEDRQLAMRLVSHWLQRWNLVIEPAYGDQEIVDIRVDDPRLGPGPWWIPWQQSVAAYGLDLAGAQFGHDRSRTVALRLAKAVLQHAWTKIDGRWKSAPVMPVPSAMAMTATGVSAPIDCTKAREWVHQDCGIPLPSIEQRMTIAGAGVVEPLPLYDESFNLYGMPLAVAVVLRQEPGNATAREIWDQCVADNRGHSWLAPGIEATQ